MSTIQEQPPNPPKPLEEPRPGLLRRLAGRLMASRKRRVTVLRIDDPDRSARGYEYSRLGLYLVTVALILSIGAVALRMADYDAKRAALREQNALTIQLREEQEHILKERDAQTQRLVDLAQQVQHLREELTTIRAFRQEVRKLLTEGPAAVSFDSDQSQAKGSRSGEQLAMGGGRPNERELLQWARDELEQADERAARLNGEMERLETDVREFNRRLNHTPSIWPVVGRITSDYGYRTHPITQRGINHDGIDIAALRGTEVRAAGAGTVTRASRYGGYGLSVMIDHDYGLETLYGHNNRLAVEVGDFVQKGEVIAYVGSTGLSTGPHLHYQVVRDSRTVDPWDYLPANG